MEIVMFEGGNISVNNTDSDKPSPDPILSDKHELSNIYGRNILKRKIIHRNCDIGSCFLSRFGVIPRGEPRQNTLIMKACQDPDNTGAEECAQTAMTQHILGVMLQSDYVIRSALHESFKCMGPYMTPHGRIMNPHQENSWEARQLQPHMETVGIQFLIQLPHHMDPHKENCSISSQSPPYRETVGTQCQIL